MVCVDPGHVDTHQGINERDEGVVINNTTAAQAAGAGVENAGTLSADSLSVHASTEGDSIFAVRDTEEDQLSLASIPARPDSAPDNPPDRQSTDLISTRALDKIGPRTSAKPSIELVSAQPPGVETVYVPQQ
jgi:hypothetical protein